MKPISRDLDGLHAAPGHAMFRGLDRPWRPAAVGCAGDALPWVAGLKGELIEMKPGSGSAFGVDPIFLTERRDGPCLLRVEGRDLGNRNARPTCEVSQCDGPPGDSKNRITVKLTDSDGNDHRVAALRERVPDDPVARHRLDPASGEYQARGEMHHGHG